MNAERLRIDAHVRLSRRHPPLSERTGNSRVSLCEAIAGRHRDIGLYSRYRTHWRLVGQRNRCGSCLVLSCVRVFLVLVLEWELTWVWV